MGEEGVEEEGGEGRKVGDEGEKGMGRWERGEEKRG